ncbi:MAG TPA: PorP/SprF family type IX secretion system membrane protein, partial [Chitinophaga sp.]
ADMYAGRRVGLGLNIFNDQAGLIQRTRVGLSYAYHLPLHDPGKQLHFGLSLAFNTAYIDRKNINGDNSDPSVARFNQRDNYFEGEYGMAYTDRHLTVQASLPNVISLVKKDPNDAVNGGTLFYSAVGYRFLTGTAVSAVEPKVAYRDVKGYNNILDFGANVAFLNNAFNITGLYHTTKSFTAGVGFRYKSIVALQGFYTSQTGGIKSYVDGTFEVALTINLFN